jgi:3-oxoadipate enol-lactonase
MTPVELHHEASGPRGAPALLMGGSLGTTLAMWEPQVAALSGRYRVIRFDHRGHGASPVPEGPYTMDELGSDVLALMDRLGLTRTHYCGLSIGGMVGQWLAINAPERLGRLALLCTSPHMPPRDAWEQRAAAVREAGTPGAIADTIVARWFTPQFAERHPQVRERFTAMIGTVAAEGYAGCCEAIAALDFRDALSTITVPTLVIAGAQDPATPPDHGEQIARAAHRGRLEVLDPGAHLVNVERPEEVTRLLLDHFGGDA